MIKIVDFNNCSYIKKKFQMILETYVFCKQDWANINYVAYVVIS